MTVKAKVQRTGSLREAGWTSVEGWTWHPTIWDRGDTAKVECYEVYWDAEGQGHPTGRRREMTQLACEQTQKVDGVGTRDYAEEHDGATE